MKHYPLATANALAATTAVIYLLYAATVALLPDLSMTIAQSWFLKPAVGSFVLGIITATVGAWLIGFVFAKIYNQFVQ